VISDAFVGNKYESTELAIGLGFPIYLANLDCRPLQKKPEGSAIQISQINRGKQAKLKRTLIIQVYIY